MIASKKQWVNFLKKKKNVILISLTISLIINYFLSKDKLFKLSFNDYPLFYIIILATIIWLSIKINKFVKNSY